jgi:formylglycine-generating enzyme required for sulfatase activity
MSRRGLAGVWVLLLGGLLVAAGGPPAAPPGTKVDDKVLLNGIGMKLTLIPAGKFLMGSPAGEAERTAGEVQHEVAITRPFYMGVYEVTQGEYAKVMGEPRAAGKYNQWNWGARFAAAGGGLDHPMENVAWRQAVEFCKRLSAMDDEKRAGRKYRLPTEAEWEYACRAGTTTPFHYGDALSSKQANFNGLFPYGGAEKGIYRRQTMKVGSFAPNAFGLYDMHGNVAEWCSDYYDKDYYRHSPREDPQGPAQGVLPTDYKDFYRVVRGGSWLDEGRACRSAYRYRAMPSDGYHMIGFRVVCTVEAKTP